MTTDLEQRLREALHEDAERARLVNPVAPPAPEAQPLAIGSHLPPSWRRVVAVAAVLALIVAAGIAVIQNGDRAPDVNTIAEDPKDLAMVDGALLTADDLPTGWVAASAEDEEPRQAAQPVRDQAFADCLGIDVSELQTPTATVDAAFVNSSAENDEEIVSKVSAFATVDDVRTAIDRFREDAARQCYLAGVEEQVAQGARNGLATVSGRALSVDDVQIGESTIEEMDLEYLDAGFYYRLGDYSIALRFKVPVSSEGVDIDVYVDVAFVRVGRVLVLTSFQTYFTAFGGGAGTSQLVPRDVALVTKTVVDRIPGVTTPDPADSGDQQGAGPPVLPEAGDQPTDSGAAEEQIRTAFVTLFDASRPRDERAEFVERPEVWGPANQALVDGEYGEVVQDQRAVVSEVVFTSPDHAAVRFHLTGSSQLLPSGDQIGDAVLVDGKWLVAIATPCSLIAMASVQCDMSL